MPQGTVLPIRPIGLSTDECMESLKAFFKEHTGQEIEIGLVETCALDGGDSDIMVGEKLIFIVPKTELDGVVEGDCESLNKEELENKPSKVKFKFYKGPFKLVYEIKK